MSDSHASVVKGIARVIFGSDFSGVVDTELSPKEKIWNFDIKYRLYQKELMRIVCLIYITHANWQLNSEK